MVCSLAAVALQVELKHEIAVFYQVTFSLIGLDIPPMKPYNKTIV
jgi:hypothetical protein